MFVANRIFVFFGFVAMTLAYPEGPPIYLLPSLCTSMMPQHLAQPQTSEAPYEIVVSGSCYKAGTTLTVRVRIVNPEDPDNFFEGFLLQARSPGDDSQNFGTFDALDTEGMTEQSCYGKDKSAISHNAAEHWLARTFEWTAPNSNVGDLEFVATVVQHADTFWMNVNSDMITYDANCGATTGLEPEEYGDIQPETASVVVSGCSTFAPQLLLTLVAALLAAVSLF